MKTHLKITFLIFFLIPLNNELYAQKPITWQRTYGDGNIDYGYSIVQTPDEGFIAVGRKRINTTSYMFVMRLNKYGDTIWTKTYSGGWAYQIEELSDGNYLISSFSYNGPLIKIDVNGNTLWTKNNSGGYIKPSIDSGFYLYREYILSKYNYSGKVIWNFNYTKFISNGTLMDYVIRSDNSVLALVRKLSSESGSSFFLIRLDNLGRYVSLGEFNFKISVSKLISIGLNNVVYCGYNQSGATSTALFDTSGNLIWTKSYDLGPPEQVITRSFIRTFDEGFAIGGVYSSGNANYYMRIIKTDSLGQEQFRSLYGFDDNDQPYCLRQTDDSGYVLIGIRDNFNLGDIYIVKTNKKGFANPPVSISNNVTTLFLSDYQLFQNYPNPFNPETKIKFYLPQKDKAELKIYNLNGIEVKLILNQTILKGYYEINFDGQNLSSGVYYCQLKTNSYRKTIKMLLIK